MKKDSKITYDSLLTTGWIAVEDKLPEIGKPVIVLTDYGKCDVCRLGIYDGYKLLWTNDMRPQHTDGSVIAWAELLAIPTCN